MGLHRKQKLWQFWCASYWCIIFYCVIRPIYDIWTLSKIDILLHCATFPRVTFNSPLSLVMMITMSINQKGNMKNIIITTKWMNPEMNQQLVQYCCFGVLLNADLSFNTLFNPPTCSLIHKADGWLLCINNRSLLTVTVTHPRCSMCFTVFNRRLAEHYWAIVTAITFSRRGKHSVSCLL